MRDSLGSGHHETGMLDFDRGLDPTTPLTPDRAVARGRKLINAPVSFIIAGGFLLGLLVFGNSALILVPGIVSFVGAWLWWSYWIPRWRAWALRRGVDPGQLQAAGERAKLVWPRGHILEKTEFRYREDEHRHA